MFVLKFKSSKEEDLDAEESQEESDSVKNTEDTDSSEKAENSQSEEKIVPVSSQTAAADNKPKTIPIEDPEEVLREVEQNSAKDQF